MQRSIKIWSSLCHSSIEYSIVPRSWSEWGMRCWRRQHHQKRSITRTLNFYKVYCKSFLKQKIISSNSIVHNLFCKKNCSNVLIKCHKKWVSYLPYNHISEIIWFLAAIFFPCAIYGQRVIIISWIADEPHPPVPTIRNVWRSTCSFLAILL